MYPVACAVFSSVGRASVSAGRLAARDGRPTNFEIHPYKQDRTLLMTCRRTLMEPPAILILQ